MKNNVCIVSPLKYFSSNLLPFLYSMILNQINVMFACWTNTSLSFVTDYTRVVEKSRNVRHLYLFDTEWISFFVISIEQINANLLNLLFRNMNKIPLLLVLLLILHSCNSLSSCPSGWIPFGPSCYMISSYEMNWYDAQKVSVIGVISL